MSKRKFVFIDYVLLFLILWGPIRIFTVAQRSPEASIQNIVDANVKLELAIWLLAGIRLLHLFVVRSLTSNTARIRIFSGWPFWFYFIYGTFGVISIFYSPAPLLSLFRALQLLCCVSLFAFWVSNEDEGDRHVLNVFILFSIGLTVYQFVMYWVMPDMVGVQVPEGFRLIGGYPFTPDYGFAAVVTVAFCIVSIIYERRNIEIYFLSAIGMFVLLMSRTRSIIIGLIVSFLIAQLLTQKIKVGKITIYIIIIVCIFLFNFAEILAPFIIRNPDTFFEMSFRIELWEKLIPSILERPFLGYGFAAGSRIHLFDWLSLGINIGNAHNVWIEALLFVGLFGTSFLLLSLIFILRSVKQIQAPGKIQMFFYMMIFITIAVSITTTSINYVSPFYSLLIVYSGKELG